MPVKCANIFSLYDMCISLSGFILCWFFKHINCALNIKIEGNISFISEERLESFIGFTFNLCKYLFKITKKKHEHMNYFSTVLI